MTTALAPNTPWPDNVDETAILPLALLRDASGGVDAAVPRPFVLAGSLHATGAYRPHFALAFHASLSQRGVLISRPSQTVSHAALFLSRFVAALRAIPEVRRVAVQTDGADLCIRTIIDAPTGDFSARNAVYDAELAAYATAQDIAVDFQLVNIADYPGRTIDEFIPSGSHTIYSK